MSTSSIPTNMKAYVIGSKSIIWPLQVAFTKYENQLQLVTKPVPKPEDNELLIKVEVYAANPTDVLHLDLIGPAGSIIGCDVVGTVVAVGRGVTRHKVGDRVVGAIHGGKYDNIGSAAEYCVAADDLVFKVPQSISSEDAATFGVGLLTAAGALYHIQGVPRSPARVPNAPWYFVSGGATSVGMFAIQLAKQAGFRVIASASPRSFDLVKRYGADHVVSYADHTAALKEIKEVTQNGVVQAMDCVGGKANLRFAVDAFGPSGGDIVSILPGGKSHRSDVKLQDFLLYRYLGKAFTFIPIIRTYPAEPEKREWLADFTSTATEMIETYGIRPNPVEIGQGFEAIPDGLKKLRVSGKKLVFKL